VTAADDEDAVVVPNLDRCAAVRLTVRGARLAGTARTNGGARPGRTPRGLGRGRVGKAQPGTAGGLGRHTTWMPKSAGARARAMSRRGGALA
jgi:hypothetical protein